MAYSKYFSKTLKDAIQEQLDTPPLERLQLFEELALMRDLAGQSIALYSIAREAAASQPGNERLIACVLGAGETMRLHLAEVVNVCEKAARLDEAAKDKISIHTLTFVVNQIVKCAYDVFGDDPRIMILDTMLKNKVRLPSTGTAGTDLTPDLDVQAMDATVPRRIEHANGNGRSPVVGDSGTS